MSKWDKHCISTYNKDIEYLNEEERQLKKRLQEINIERTKKQRYIAEIYLSSKDNLKEVI